MPPNHVTGIAISYPSTSTLHGHKKDQYQFWILHWLLCINTDRNPYWQIYQCHSLRHIWNDPINQFISPDISWCSVSARQVGYRSSYLEKKTIIILICAIWGSCRMLTSIKTLSMSIILMTTIYQNVSSYHHKWDDDDIIFKKLRYSMNAPFNCQKQLPMESSSLTTWLIVSHIVTIACCQGEKYDIFCPKSD